MLNASPLGRLRRGLRKPNCSELLEWNEIMKLKCLGASSWAIFFSSFPSPLLSALAFGPLRYWSVPLFYCRNTCNGAVSVLYFAWIAFHRASSLFGKTLNTFNNFSSSFLLGALRKCPSIYANELMSSSLLLRSKCPYIANSPLSTLLRVAVISAKNHKRQRRKRQSVTAKGPNSNTNLT